MEPRQTPRPTQMLKFIKLVSIALTPSTREKCNRLNVTYLHGISIKMFTKYGKSCYTKKKVK